MGKGQFGWALVDGFFLHYDHGLFAFTPIIRSDTKEMVVCLEQSVTEQVLALLETDRRDKVKIAKKPFLTDGVTGFFVDDNLRDDSPELKVVTSLDVEMHCTGNIEPYKIAQM